ncbi:MFS transporter [Actinomadura viridis]|uniref:MFS family arabinose efflux permease n=1 Tax=Actinomadura viridis TaxID=58110 RepID=A0A931GPG5_9ACTN|nr:MFS transporter [Actinomadura viridis]MBG6093890.1 putative MFS family arabinose efflux permease [Actinomadura viridis]
MRTYGELFRSPEFTPLFATSAFQVAATTVSGLALSTLVYAATGSPLLAALSMFGQSLVQMIGAVTLLSAADRIPPRAATAGLALASAAGTAALAVPGLPGWAGVAVVVALGLVASVGGGVRYGLLSEILPADGYLIGRSVLNMTTGTMQICGFAAGAGLLAVLSPRGTLLAGAALHLTAALVARLRLARRPPRAAGRPSVAQTWRANGLLLSSPSRRRVYLAMWVPNGLIVGCESLFVPYTPRNAGLLLAFAALGMLAGDTVMGRFATPSWRSRLGPRPYLLLAVPYLLFALDPGLPLALAAVTIASAGFSGTLLLQERLLSLTPETMRGQALGLQSSGMLTMQGVSAALAGTIAQHTSPGTAMAVLAAVSVAVTLSLAPGLRPVRAAPPVPEPPAPQQASR